MIKKQEKKYNSKEIYAILHPWVRRWFKTGSRISQKPKGML